VNGVKTLAVLVASLAVAAPPKTVRLAIVHTVHGCHVFASSRELGAAPKLTVAPGARLVLRVNCPMTFTFRQVRGPKLAFGDPMFYPGTQRTIVFAKRGTYVLAGVNVQSSADMGLQTLGPDNHLTLTVVVR